MTKREKAVGFTGRPFASPWCAFRTQATIEPGAPAGREVGGRGRAAYQGGYGRSARVGGSGGRSRPVKKRLSAAGAAGTSHAPASRRGSASGESPPRGF